MKLLIPTLFLASTFSLISCAPYQSPCDSLPEPSVKEKLLNPDIEVNIGGVECDYENGRWQEDVDISHSASKRNTRSSATPTPTSSPKPTPSNTKPSKAPSSSTKKPSPTTTKAKPARSS